MYWDYEWICWNYHGSFRNTVDYAYIVYHVSMKYVPRQVSSRWERQVVILYDDEFHNVRLYLRMQDAIDRLVEVVQ